jgi:hypothetical protein
MVLGRVEMKLNSKIFFDLGYPKLNIDIIASSFGRPTSPNRMSRNEAKVILL